MTTRVWPDASRRRHSAPNSSSTMLFLPARMAFSSAGCASAPFPDETLRGVDRSLRLGALRASPSAYRGARVMLGGQIIATVPKPGVTEIEILSRRLGDSGAPESGDRSDGRFLARSAKLLDPAIYAPGRRL